MDIVIWSPFLLYQVFTTANCEIVKCRKFRGIFTGVSWGSRNSLQNLNLWSCSKLEHQSETIIVWLHKHTER